MSDENEGNGSSGWNTDGEIQGFGHERFVSTVLGMLTPTSTSAEVILEKGEGGSRDGGQSPTSYPGKQVRVPNKGFSWSRVRVESVQGSEGMSDLDGPTTGGFRRQTVLLSSHTQSDQDGVKDPKQKVRRSNE